MKAAELLASILKGNEVGRMSEKQRSYLLALAKAEGIKMSPDSNYLYFENCHYHIRNSMRPVAAYGGGIGKAIIPGVYRLERLYTIQFTDTGFTQVAHDYDLRSLTERGFSYTIINQL